MDYYEYQKNAALFHDTQQQHGAPGFQREAEEGALGSVTRRTNHSGKFQGGDVRVATVLYFKTFTSYFAS